MVLEPFAALPVLDDPPGACGFAKLLVRQYLNEFGGWWQERRSACEM